jgi:hypothetical protein
LKLLDVPTPVVGVVLLAVALVGLPVWGAVDAAAHPQSMWESAGLSRRGWIRWQAFGAPIGIGFAVAAAYFAKTRPQLRPATLSHEEEAAVPPRSDDAGFR